MPTIVESILSPFDNSAQVKENIADLLDTIDRREVPLLALLGWSMEGDITKGADSLKYPCTQKLHIWQNDQLMPSEGTLLNAYASGAGVMTLASGEGNYVYVDEQIMIVSSGTPTFYTVNAISGDSITVSVVSGQSDAAHSAGDKWRSLGRPAVAGETFATLGRTIVPSTDENYTQIFGGGQEGAVAITGSEQSTEYHGITNRLDFEVAKKLTELAIKLERAMIYSYRSNARPTANAQPASRMGGLWHFIAELSGGIVTNANGDRLTASESKLRDGLDTTWGLGGNPSVMMSNAFQRREFSDFLMPFIRNERDNRIYGVIMSEYEYSHGRLKVMLNKWVDDSHLFVFTPEYLGIGPLNGNGNSRAFKQETLPKDGDYERRNVIGEYTAEVRNRQRAHFVIKNLAVS